MITYKEETFNSWKDIVDKYPAMWVVFDKAELKHGKIQSGSIMAILPDEEIIAFRDTHLGEVKLSLRTTETVKMNIDLDAMLATRNRSGEGDDGDRAATESNRSTAGLNRPASGLKNSTVSVVTGGIGGYIHGELIDA